MIRVFIYYRGIGMRSPTANYMRYSFLAALFGSVAAGASSLRGVIDGLSTYIVLPLCDNAVLAFFFQTGISNSYFEGIKNAAAACGVSYVNTPCGEYCTPLQAYSFTGDICSAANSGAEAYGPASGLTAAAANLANCLVNYVQKNGCVASQGSGSGSSAGPSAGTIAAIAVCTLLGMGCVVGGIHCFLGYRIRRGEERAALLRHNGG